MLIRMEKPGLVYVRHGPALLKSGMTIIRVFISILKSNNRSELSFIYNKNIFLRNLSAVSSLSVEVRPRGSLSRRESRLIPAAPKSTP